MTAPAKIMAPPMQPRAEGAAAFVVAHDGYMTRLADFRQQGSMKMLWPRAQDPAHPLQAVMLNTAGGLTGGDRMACEAVARAGAYLEITTQAAERVYRAQPHSVAVVDNRLTVGAGAQVDWLPQETILYDQSAIRRRLTVDLASDASAVIVEPLIFGRRAMGETLGKIAFDDRWLIRRAGRAVFADALRLSGDVETALDRPAMGQGARAMASALYAGPKAESLLQSVRAILPATAGASLVRKDILFIRILAEDGFALRQSLVPVITCLTGRALPKVWRL